MGRRSDDPAFDLEPIDLTDEDDARETRPRSAARASRRLPVAFLLPAAVIVIAGLAFVLIRSDHGRGHATSTPVTRTPPAPRPTSAPAPARVTEPLVGRFYPVLGRTDAATIVLPTGLTFAIAHGASTAIGGLGATSFGTVRPEGATCCALDFDILHAAPSDLFTTLGPGPITTPVLASSADAVPPELRQFNGRLGVLSTGDWTLIASFQNGYRSPRANAFIFEALATWHVVSTSSGAFVRVPAGSIVDNAEIDFGRVPDLSDRAVDFVRSEPCQIGPTPTFFGTAADTTGRWCDRGLAVTIEGPRAYVTRAVANLVITRDH